MGIYIHMSERAMSKGKVILFGLAACLLYGIGAGLRSDIGILLQPIAAQTGLTYARVSFCIAAMQLVFGIAQPLFGILAARSSNRFVLILGSALIIGGLLGIRASYSFVPLFLSLSLVFALGVGAVAFGLVYSSAVYFVGASNAMLISGMLNAAAGMIGFIFSPMINALIESGGLSRALLVVSLLTVLLIPITFLVTARDPKRGAAGSVDGADRESPEKIRPGALAREAWHNRTYRLLIAGFSTCGFHMVIIESHLFSQFKSYGISGESASWAFSVYGIATIVGALLSGWMSARFDKGKLLTFYYGFRALWVAIYLFLLPKNFGTALLFAIGLGMTGDATVSPTSGLVNQEFSIQKVATLVGFLFLCHQIGAFLSSWLGGILVEATGGYVAIWAIDIAVCMFACVMSGMISHRRNRDEAIHC